MHNLKERNHWSSVKYWKAATSKDRAMAHDVEVRRMEALRNTEALASKHGLRWCCGHCDYSLRAPWGSPLTFDELRAHVEDEWVELCTRIWRTLTLAFAPTPRHAVEDPSQENGDIYLHPESWLDVGPIEIK